MSDLEFEELVNLYLDNEIGERELWLLKEELRNNADRRRRFTMYCRLHNASCMALCGNTLKRRNRARLIVAQRRKSNSTYYLTQTSLAAACVVLAFMIFAPMLSQNDSSVQVAGPSPELNRPAERGNNGVLAKRNAKPLPVILAKMTETPNYSLPVVIAEGSASPFELEEEFTGDFLAEIDTDIPVVGPNYRRQSNFPTTFENLDANPRAQMVSFRNTPAKNTTGNTGFSHFYFQR